MEARNPLRARRHHCHKRRPRRERQLPYPCFRRQQGSHRPRIRRHPWKRRQRWRPSRSSHQVRRSHLLRRPRQLRRSHLLRRPRQLRRSHLLRRPRQLRRSHLLRRPRQLRRSHLRCCLHPGRHSYRRLLRSRRCPQRLARDLPRSHPSSSLQTRSLQRASPLTGLHWPSYTLPAPQQSHTIYRYRGQVSRLQGAGCRKRRLP